jgi:hypothetical protein
MNRDFRLELVLYADWERIDFVREAVAKCTVAAFGDCELKNTLAMVSAELLENALKHGQPERGVTVTLGADAEHLVVTVGNFVEKSSQHPRTLERRVMWIRRFANPHDAYVAALRDVYQGRGPDCDSGLGIARISYEGRCQLVCDISRPGFVQVTARCRRPNLAQARSA